MDDTLVPEREAWIAAFNFAGEKTAQAHHLDLETLRLAVFTSALELWETSPVIEYCQRVGIGSPSSLLSDFPGEGKELAFLRSWAPKYRREAWTMGLREVGVSDPALVEECEHSFRAHFGRLHRPFSDVEPALDRLAGKSLGVLTNGASDLQRSKLQACGLEGRFVTVLISAELGIGKPDPRIFELALEEVGAQRDECVMVGDSLQRDIEGASKVGIPSLWLNRSAAVPADSKHAASRIQTLEDLPAMLEGM